MKIKLLIFLFFKVSTIFWCDNFDRNVETAFGAGSIHNTPGIAFQEHSAAAVMRQEDITIFKSKKRSIVVSSDNVDKRVAVNPKAEPPLFSDPALSDAKMFWSKLLVLWKSVRYLNSANQTKPRFVGWIVRRFQQAHSKVTLMTYLPPILPQ